eukprot:9482865-Pyramimonas_sp.AAC.1
MPTGILQFPVQGLMSTGTTPNMVETRAHPYGPGPPRRLGQTGREGPRQLAGQGPRDLPRRKPQSKSTQSL